MHELKAQRVLIAFIKRKAPEEWAMLRAQLRREWAQSFESSQDRAYRICLGQAYRQRKAAATIRVARYLALDR